MQNLKAVAMSVVTVIAFFWSNRPNPAITGKLTFEKFIWAFRPPRS